MITTDHGGGGAKELIENGINGILVPVGNDRILAQKIQEVIEDEDYRNKLGHAAEKIRFEDSIQSIAERWKKYTIDIVK